jgi:hypothetical protein
LAALDALVEQFLTDATATAVTAPPRRKAK